MAGMCCEVVGESETASSRVESKASKRRRRQQLDLSSLKFMAADVGVVAPPPLDNDRKRQKKKEVENSELESNSVTSEKIIPEPEAVAEDQLVNPPKFGITSIRGRRKDMEDAVAAHPSFYRRRRSDEKMNKPSDLHFFGVYDGHGCSHVAMKCKDRFHGIVKEELEGADEEEVIIWKELMDRSFSRMDREAVVHVSSSNCRCELQPPRCDAVGSTAVVALVTPEKIVVSNCGDSRAVLCRNAVATPLSSDHKPDRPDELDRIEKAGGRVIYWDGARVLGVLAMSRAIGDHYLKPFVISEPEVTVTDRTAEDEFLILASDGLWDVVSNETACAVVRMCLLSGAGGGDKACSDASIVLTRLALARHSSDNVSVLVVDLRRPL
ncbi:protein phosphatase 2C 37-like [Impatiens glandulifera]|uniref:protein phosphatase 2C 37-like n=1 Tax=Impatiens glandulifera TaxID=253017 RepID=UPI001FB06F32|nr:protein phosphatase 2C 37-like [Impatiens glandulifera]